MERYSAQKQAISMSTFIKRLYAIPHNAAAPTFAVLNQVRMQFGSANTATFRKLTVQRTKRMQFDPANTATFVSSDNTS